MLLTWRWPLLFSVLLHALVFWPAALHRNDSGVVAPRQAQGLRAELRPVVPLAEPALPARAKEAVRHTDVTQNSYMPPSRASSQTEAEAVSTSAPALQATVGLDAGGVRAYRIALGRSLVSARLREGLSPDMRGQLELGIAVTEVGAPARVEILRSSGQPALDARVLAAMRAVAPDVAVPEVLLGRAFVLSLPVEVGPAPEMFTSAAGR